MFSNLIVSLAIVLCVAQCGQCLYKPCTLEWLPICGSDGVTYGNKCLFAQAVKKDSALTVAFEGSCEEGPRARNAPICTLEWLPICGSDGVTYGNKCFFAQAVKKDSALTVAFEGSCEEGPRARNAPICTLEWLPICGSDGVTYGNKCFFAQAVKKDSALTVAFEGSCEEGPRARNAQICTLEWLPICGSDGVTYGNKCFFAQAVKKDSALTVAFEGSCEEGPRARKSVACTLEWFPICGSDGVTYGNKCLFAQAVKKDSTLTVAFEGSCEEGPRARNAPICTLEWLPICGSDGVTYGNKCFFAQAVKKDSALTVAFEGSCEEGPRARSAPICTLEWLPICGSDGVTYGNKCFFAQAVKKDSTLTVAFEGSCEEGPRARNAQICTLEWIPICGSDGVTYGNKCFFAQAVKKDSALTVAFEGSCEEGPRARKSIACTLEWFPICGSDGVTYGNKCFFAQAVKKDSALTVAFEGSCEEGPRARICTLEYFPICGSDGVTYGNQCFFDFAARKDDTLKIVGYGKCEDIKDI